MTRARLARLGLVVCLAAAFLVWNAVFDRMVMLAGQRYLRDASVSYATSGRYLLVDPIMRPAVAHAARVASLAALAVVLGGAGLYRYIAGRIGT
jgi:hypothetical protein